MNTTLSQDMTRFAPTYAPPVIDYTISVDCPSHVELDFRPITLGRLIELREMELCSYFSRTGEWGRITQGICEELAATFYLGNRSKHIEGIRNVTHKETTVNFWFGPPCDRDYLIERVKDHLRAVAGLNGILM